MKRIYLLPNLVTAFSLSCGLFIIFRIILFSQAEMPFTVFKSSVILLLVAGLADVCDGAIARILGAESEFGVQFDSLADSITFGVTPAVIVLRSFSIPLNSPLFFLLSASAIVLSLCGVLRLARYNVGSSQKKETLNHRGRKIFTGLPIPAAGLSVVSANLFLISDEFRAITEMSEKTRAIIMISVMFVVGYFMVSRWKFPGVKTFNIRVKSFFLVFVTAISAVVLLYGIFHLFSFTLFAIFWAYLIIAWSLSIIRLILGHHSKRLEDFEPEEDQDKNA
ncbi:MAG: hypothetical protein S4CHLAM7_15060 [Chlamydiae bacterium]|nr:hypothetical protein [Chlamydiota bacterium]